MFYNTQRCFGIDTKNTTATVTATIVIIAMELHSPNKLPIAYKCSAVAVAFVVAREHAYESGALLQVHLHKYSYQKCKCMKC